MSFKNAHLPIQKTILRYAKTGYVSGILRAIIAAAAVNNTITARDFGTEDGKLRDLKINYLPPICAAEGTCADNICEAGTVIEPKQVFYQLKKCTASPVLTLRMSDMRDLDSIGADEYSLALIANLMEKVRETLAQDVAAVLAANQGCQLDGSETKQISLVSPINGSVNPLGKAEIDKTFLDAKLSGTQPFIVGGSSVFYAQEAQGIAGQNFLGQQVNKVTFPNTYYDKTVNEQYESGEHIWAFDPSVMKFLSFNYNAGRFATDLKDFSPERMFKSGADWYSGTLLDPATGILWDLDAIYDKCSKTWNFQFKLNWDIFFLPQAVCNIACVNGLFHFTTCQMLPVECPAVTPVPPVETAEYCATPDADCYPKFISKVTIGNQLYYPNVNVANLAEFVAMLNGLGTYVFEADGTEVKYTGYSGIVVTINDTAVLTFVECV